MLEVAYSYTGVEGIFSCLVTTLFVRRCSTSSLCFNCSYNDFEKTMKILL